MNALYTLILLFGILLLIAAPDVRSERPRDFRVASVLSESPTGWTISLDSNVAQYLSRYDVKAELETALRKRCMYEHKDHKWFGISGVVLVAFSMAGLIREKKIKALKKQVDSQKPC